MKFLIIQNAFIGDVILATAVVEKLHQHHPNSQIDFMLRKGNESLLKNHPFINEVYVWDKKNFKYKNLVEILRRVRSIKYDYVINLHRFGSSGFITTFSGAKHKIGFSKNPFSFSFTQKFSHKIGNGTHEVERNNQLIAHLTDERMSKPKLYPSESDFSKAKEISGDKKYVCIAPASVWFTKQFPKEKWIELINELKDVTVFLIGAESDFELCENILRHPSVIRRPSSVNLSGKLSLLQTVALMQHAQMNYVNDSAPMHIASAMNAPVTAVFCSTITDFGFGPLSDKSKIVEAKEKLDCRPCGLHGYKQCPEGHFKCAFSIDIKNILSDGEGN